MCHVSHVMCHVSHVTSHLSHVKKKMLDKVVELVLGGSVINEAYPVKFFVLALFNSTKNTQRVACWDMLSVRSNNTHKSPSSWPHPGALLCPRPSAWPLSIQVCVTSVWNSSHSNAAASVLGFHWDGLEMFKMSSSFHRTEFHSLVELHSDIEAFNDIFLTSWKPPEIIQNFVLALHA